MTDYSAPEGTAIGHVHLRVSDLDRSIAFYGDLLGFSLQQKFGDEAAFLGAGGYHHHIGLNTWSSRNGPPTPPGHAGLYHAAILYPDNQSLAVAVKRVLDAGIDVYGAADHGVSIAFYFDDPDGNGIEVYADRHPDEWPRNDAGELAMNNQKIDVAQFIQRNIDQSMS